MSGVIRGEAVTRSNVNWNTNTAVNCLSERRRHQTVVRWGKLRGGDGEGGPAAVNTGRNIQLSVKFIPLVQDCSCGVTHTQRLLGSLFVHSEHFAKLDRNEKDSNCLEMEVKNILSLGLSITRLPWEFSKNSKLTIPPYLIWVFINAHVKRNSTIFPPHYHDCGFILYEPWSCKKIW